MSPARHVLDTSAFLAYLQDEPGAEAVAEALKQGAAMSAANWAEVLSKLAGKGLDPHAEAQRLEREGIIGTALEVYPLDADMALTIARLRPPTRSPGLSLGDRACLALALSLRLPVLTTDRDWRTLKVGVKVRLVR